MTALRPLLAEAVQVGRFERPAPYQRFAYACGALLVTSGLVHVGVYFVDGGPWSGPVSWRKPVVFGLSFGITLATLSWVVGLLRPPKVVGWLVLGTLSVASVGEVALISLQRWRGVASHFNEDTAFDGAVFSLMGLLVSLVGLMVVLVTAWSMIRIDVPPSLALAVRGGLLLMLLSMAVGAQMIVVGGNTFGAAGALKLPHAVTLHAAQVLPLLALVLLVSDGPERRRVRTVALGALGYTLLIVATLVQTYGGYAPLNVGTLPAVLAAAGLGVLAASMALAVRRLGSRIRPPRTTTPGAAAAG